MANQHTTGKMPDEQLRQSLPQVSFNPKAKMSLRDAFYSSPERETPIAISEWLQALVEIDPDTADFLGICIDGWITRK